MRAFRKPIVVASVLAMMFAISGFGLPDLTVKSLALMAPVSGGAALFLIGLILSAKKIRMGASAAIQTMAANVVHPLIAAGLAMLFAAAPLMAREAIVLTDWVSGPNMTCLLAVANFASARSDAGYRRSLALQLEMLRLKSLPE
ncbi:AEC family transporter [Lichenihabitans psoromatis]|uniref:AEC family transporter n=1 Tax=Lichenihabitans psoromatis TaxID=2528642 RepID=UPI0013F16D6C|nr:AEC family transporter [Lichenihabitans psoromatis]